MNRRSFILFVLFLSFNIQAQNLQDGLILEMNFSNNLNESIFNVNTGGTPGLSFVEDRAGNPQCALRFGDPSQLVEVQTTVDNNISNQTDFSLSLWIRLTAQDIATDGDLHHLFRKQIMDNSFVFGMNLHDGQKSLVFDDIGFELWDEGPGADSIFMMDTVNWHHLVFTVDSNYTPRLYRNGLLQNVDSNYVFQVEENFREYKLGSQYAGLMDDVRLYNRALSAAEVVQLFVLDPECQQSCTLSDLVVEHECINDSAATVSIDFNHANTSQTFLVQGNGTNYGYYHYNDLPLQLTVGASNGLFYEFIIRDSLYGDCQLVSEYGFINCASDSTVCDLSNLVLDFDECINDEEYRVYIDVDYNNVSNNYFDLFQNGQFVGFYAFSDLPLPVIVESGAEDYDYFILCVNDDSCCIIEFLLNPNCGSDSTANCDLANLIVEHECINDSMATVTIDFYHANTSQTFLVQGNGTNYGYYHYNDLPLQLTVGASSGLFYEFVIRDSLYGDCQLVSEYGFINCASDSTVCDLSNLVLDFDECINDEEYRVYIDVDYSNVSNNYFDLFQNGQFIGFYAFSDLPLPVIVEPGAEDYDYFILCVNDDSCCIDGFLLNPDCDTDSTANCELWDLVVEHECINDSAATVSIDFNHANTSQTFLVQGNGTNYGYYHYNDLPLQLTVGASNGLFYEFIIRDSLYGDCQLVSEYGFINCASDSTVCELSNLILDFDECINDTVYRVYLDVDYTGSNASNFELYENGQLHGSYAFHDLPLALYFGTSDLPFIHFLLCVDGAFDCCVDYVLVPPNCNEVNIVSTEFKDLSWKKINNDTYEVESQKEMDMLITDLTGRTLIYKANVTKERISTFGWASGIYYISFTRNGQVLNKKIMVLG